MTDDTTEPKTDFFKLAVAILIAVVAVTAAVGGGRAGFLNTEDGELARTGVLNKTRQSQINLSHQLTAMDQALLLDELLRVERLVHRGKLVAEVDLRLAGLFWGVPAVGFAVLRRVWGGSARAHAGAGCRRSAP